MNPKRIVGLIGGIGSGKSCVAAAFAKRSARVISGDQAGHEALKQPEIRDEVVKRWGKELIDEKGEVNRRALGRIVFAKQEELRALEAMVFPWIGQRLRDEIAAAARDVQVPLIVLDAAVMLEAGWNNVCDRIVYVHAPRDVRLRRLAETRGWTAKDVAARECAQMSLTEKATRADFAVDNSGSPEELERQVEAIWRMLV